MEVVYVLSNSVALNRKLDAPRTARDEKRRATHNEGKLTQIFESCFEIRWQGNIMFNISLFRRNFRVSQHRNYLKPLSLNVDIFTRFPIEVLLKFFF